MILLCRWIWKIEWTDLHHLPKPFSRVTLPVASRVSVAFPNSPTATYFWKTQHVSRLCHVCVTPSSSTGNKLQESFICHRRHLKFTRRSSLLYTRYTMSLSIYMHVYLYLKKVRLLHTDVCVVVSNSSLVPVRSATMKAGTNQSARVATMLEVHGGNFTVTQTKGRFMWNMSVCIC